VPSLRNPWIIFSNGLNGLGAFVSKKQNAPKPIQHNPIQSKIQELILGTFIFFIFFENPHNEVKVIPCE
jgi:hypothetical protein